MAQRPPATLAGLPVFTCLRRPGNLVLTPSACATSHKMAQGAIEEAKVRLWECIDCPTGAKHLGALGTARPGKRPPELPDQMHNLLRFVRTRGRVTANDAAAHFARHRSTVFDQLVALESKGLIRRIEREGGPLEWEAAL